MRWNGDHVSTNGVLEPVASPTSCLHIASRVVLHYLQRNRQSGPNPSSPAGNEDGFALQTKKRNQVLRTVLYSHCDESKR